VPVAQVVRRLRELGMPLNEVKAVLQAPDLSARNELIVAHLTQMESELARLQCTVASLRSLLAGPKPAVSVEHRSGPRDAGLAISEPVTMADLEEWSDAAFTTLYDAVRSAGLQPAGVGGGLLPGELFELEIADVVVFVPVAQRVASASGRTRLLEVPAAELAVALHEGPFDDLDRTYGALVSYVAEREVAVDGPIREYYLNASDRGPDDDVQPRIEVGWPIFRTA
jgi:effector-binding domain-containing protein